jgi:hypothetical protein
MFLPLVAGRNLFVRPGDSPPDINAHELGTVDRVARTRTHRISVMSRDRRIALRKEIRWKAVLIESSGSVVAPCVVVDISANGARLVLGAPAELPDTFGLVLSKNGGVRRRCEVSWQKGLFVGVRFLRIRRTNTDDVSHISDALARISAGR